MLVQRTKAHSGCTFPGSAGERRVHPVFVGDDRLVRIHRRIHATAGNARTDAFNDIEMSQIARPSRV